MTKKTRLLIVLSSISAMTLLISNLVATKLWLLPGFNIAVDGGLLIFPLSYVVGDIIVEFYGEKTADGVVWVSMILNVVAMLTFFIVQLLPPFPGWEGQEAYEAILGFAPRIMVGSLMAYAASGILNNYVFVKIKHRQESPHKVKYVGNEGMAYRKFMMDLKKGREVEVAFDDFIADMEGGRRSDEATQGYGLRAIGSSILGRLVDNTIFETIAFLGVLPLRDFIPQMVGAFVEGLVVEAVLTLTVSQIVIRALSKYIACERP